MRDEARAALKDWRTMNDKMHLLTEDDLRAMLEDEKQNGQRAAFLERIHARYSRLRTERERVEVMAHARGV